MTDPAGVPRAPLFGPADDRFHFATASAAWWETETAWFSFHVPERRLGGWLYTMARPNIGTVAGGAWVWDDSAHLPWEVPYSANYTALQLDRGTDLADATLPNGVRIRVREPGMLYELGYRDRDLVDIDLTFAGVMRPEPLTAVGSTFGSAHHFDQIGRVRGRLVLHGEAIAVDCLAVRDRTWGVRPEDRPRRAAYVTGVADEQHGFLAVTNTRDGADRIAHGFHRVGGRTVPLRAGERRVERDPRHGWITRVHVDGEDAEGNAVRAVGEPVSRIIINRHTFIDINSLVHWTLNGRSGWGEDQDMWPVAAFAAWRRQRDAGLGAVRGTGSRPDPTGADA